MLMLAASCPRPHPSPPASDSIAPAAVDSLLIRETRVKGWHFEVIRGLVRSAQSHFHPVNTPHDWPFKPLGALLRCFSSFALVRHPAPFSDAYIDL